ncbi:MAG: glycosyltransferase [Proteobacteria bacterium]|nr:glycosyltransferase [Pseudomonadota bacterium]
MHSICLLESVSRTDGGIFEAECALQRELSLGQEIEVDVVGLEDAFSGQDASRWLPLKAYAVKTRGPGALGYSPDLLAALDPKADLLYAATLWKYPSWAALQWVERTGKPMMAAPHGSLDAWALKNAAWKKRIAAVLFKDRQLRQATCLRALCTSEAEAIRAYRLTNPIAIIPNGVDLPETDQELGVGSWELGVKNKTSTARTLLFLGRIHPKKGLPNLIRGFKKALHATPSTADAPWQLVIAGWDQGGHEAELMKLCEELGIKSKKLKVEGEKVVSDIALASGLSTLDSEIIFFGPAFGNDKKSLLSTADAFVLPSFSEGLPMSVLEAWSYKLPVVMTPECNLPEGFAADAAIRIDTGTESIAQGLNSLFSMSTSDLESMGAKGRALVEERFTWKTVAAQMREVYGWMLGGGATPSSVVK